MAKKETGAAIIADIKQKKANQDAEAKATKQAAFKNWAHCIYIDAVKFIAEVSIVALAYIGLTSLIHTAENVQTGVAVLIIAFMLVIKYNLKK